MWWLHIVGLFFSVIVAGFPIRWVADSLWEAIGLTEKNAGLYGPYGWLPTASGWVDRALYYIFLHMGTPLLIAVWFAAKVTGILFWRSDGERPDRPVRRAAYSVSLVGEGLSLVYALAGAQAVRWALNRQFLLALVALSSLIVATGFFLLWIRRQQLGSAPV